MALAATGAVEYRRRRKSRPRDAVRVLLFRPLSCHLAFRHHDRFSISPAAAEAISWNDYFWDVVDAVLAGLGTNSPSFPADFVRSVVDTEPGHVASQMASLGRKLYCAEHSGVSLE